MQLKEPAPSFQIFIDYNITRMWMLAKPKKILSTASKLVNYPITLLCVRDCPFSITKCRVSRGPRYYWGTVEPLYSRHPWEMTKCQGVLISGVDLFYKGQFKFNTGVSVFQGGWIRGVPLYVYATGLLVHLGVFGRCVPSTCSYHCTH